MKIEDYLDSEGKAVLKAVRDIVDKPWRRDEADNAYQNPSRRLTYSLTKKNKCGAFCLGLHADRQDGWAATTGKELAETYGTIIR